MRLEGVELVPFRAAIAAGVASIMSAHLLAPALDAERPATLSSRVLGDLLRGIKSENANLKAEIDALKKGQAATDQSIKNLPKPLSSSEVTDITERTADSAIKKNQMPRFSLLGVNPYLVLVIVGLGWFYVRHAERNEDDEIQANLEQATRRHENASGSNRAITK